MLLKLASHQIPCYSPSRRREHRGRHFALIYSIFHEVLTSIVGCVRVLSEMSSVWNQECTSFSGAGFGEMLVTPKKLSDILAAKAIVLVTTDIPTL